MGRLSKLLWLCITTSTFSSIVSAADVAVFARKADISAAALSPNGNLIASIVRVGNEPNRPSRVEVLDTETGKRTLYFEGDNQTIILRSVDWLNDHILLLNIKVVKDPDEYEYWWRMATIDVNTGSVGYLFNKEFVRQRRSTGYVLDVLPDDAEHVLVHAGSLYKLNIYTKERDRLDVDWGFWADSGDHQWIVDAESRPRVLSRTRRHRRRVAFLDLEKNELVDKWTFDIDSADSVTPLGFDSQGLFYFVAYQNDRRVLKALEPESHDAKEHLIFSDPDYDVWGSPIRLGGNSLLGVRHPARWKDHYIEQDLRALQDQVDKIFPKAYNKLMDLSADRNRYLLLSRSDSNPGTIYIGDRKKKKLTPFALTRNRIDPEAMGQAQRIRFTARDGTPIEGVITLPRQSKGPLPFVVRVNLGSLTTRQFDPMNQMFAQAGIGVLQIDHRGTRGYGFSFEDASKNRWGLEMQDDLTDGLHYLIEQKIADANRLCIIGDVYGGYAAMMAIAKDPQRYRCAVSMTGISDLDAHVDSVPNTINQVLLKHEIGTHDDDLWSRSPLKFAKRIKTPLLLMHDKDYYGVDISQSLRMQEVLQKQGKSVQYLDLPLLSHTDDETIYREVYQNLHDFVLEHLSTKASRP